ncbi:SUF system NifU family Fe-S cluster assembly protein [Candidatus Gottesmanbacteria bacterium]|nr:SUF system NifU family Fe-S cluster assembly protein [Candidatus Gottesmanbacteria bacterium]
MDLYRDLILDHYRNPRNFGHLKNPDVVAEEYNISCGDRIVMEIKFKKKIEDVRFSGDGCAISQASASMLTEKVKGVDKKNILAMTLEDITNMLGTTLTPSRVKCALLPLEAVQNGIQRYHMKQKPK